MTAAEFDAIMAQTESPLWIEAVPDERWTARLDIEGGALCAECHRNHEGWLAGTVRVRAWVEFTGKMRDFPQPRGGIPGARDLATAQAEAGRMWRMLLGNYWQDGVDWL